MTALAERPAPFIALTIALPAEEAESLRAIALILQERDREADRARRADAVAVLNSRLFELKTQLPSQETWMLTTEEGRKAKIEARQRSLKGADHASVVYYEYLTACYHEWIRAKREEIRRSHLIPRSRLRPLSTRLGDVVSLLLRSAGDEVRAQIEGARR